MHEYRLAIAEQLLGIAMSMAPPGSKERVEIAGFVRDYFQRRLDERAAAPQPEHGEGDE